ncbi:DNA primase [Psychromonas sp. CD1]|uniref:DNA primase n=1 Tax=Psychromonas sp. CD1 TaxID=1979839 RepID=UPI000B9B7FE5|nr:DNA primase [Psychromonas sp. CD1]
MAGRIPQNFIDDLIAQTDIVDVIDSRVKLKKQGKDHRASCPFHNGNNKSSFSVSSEKQFYHCFNCGASGNIITFIMEYDGVEFIDAIDILADQLSIEVPREESTNGTYPLNQSIDRKNLYQLMADITHFYQQQLRQHRHSQKVINYLKGRGLSGKTVQHFKIGYAPDGWDEIRKRFAISIDQEKQLIEIGMLIEKSTEGKGSYDRFRDRLMFPIYDRRGRVVGFGGRVLDNSEPKYLNSPETPIFHKGKELYGLYHVKQAYKNIPRILVVEGYMDVVALAQFGIDYAVASLGTATTSDHIHTLFRHSSEIICCFDGDKAGRTAAWRALENALPYLQDGRTLRFMFLDEGEDPDSFIQKNGKQKFEILVKDALPLSDFLFQHLLTQVDMSNRDSKAKLAQLAIPLITQMSASVFKEMMEERLITLLGVEKSALIKLMSQRSISSPSKQSKKVTPMRLAISLLLQHPKIAYDLPLFPEFKEINLPGLSLLNQLLDICRTNPHINTGQLLEYWRDKPESQQLKKLAVWNNHVDDRKYEDVFLDILEKFLTLHINQKIEQLKMKSRKGETLTSAEILQLTSLLTR